MLRTEDFVPPKLYQLARLDVKNIFGLYSSEQSVAISCVGVQYLAERDAGRVVHVTYITAKLIG